MSAVDVDWRSPDWSHNATILRATHSDAFAAIAELDALAHRLIQRVASQRAERDEQVVAAAFLRRLQALFVGIRHLLEDACVEQSKPLLRAQFEAVLQTRYLIFGAKRSINAQTPTTARGRNIRARYYQAATHRRAIYRTQQVLDDVGRGLDAEQKKELRAFVATRQGDLKRAYAAQQRAMGPLACFRPKPRYHDSIPWYAYGFRRGRVRTVKALAERTGWSGEYDLFYSPLSGLVHPTGIAHDAAIVGGGLGLYSPYMVDAFPLVCRLACSWQLRGLGYLVRANLNPYKQDWSRVGKKVQSAVGHLEISIPDGFLG